LNGLLFTTLALQDSKFSLEKKEYVDWRSSTLIPHLQQELGHSGKFRDLEDCFLSQPGSPQGRGVAGSVGKLKNSPEFGRNVSEHFYTAGII
jgi:hypothetical protein